MNTNLGARSRGFTLVEILVVLAITAILSAIVLAVFVRVRERSRSGVCQSNLKQIALALQQYVQDFDGHYPDAGLIGTDQKQWATHIRSYVGDTRVFMCPTRTALGGSNGLNGSATINYDYNVLRLNNYSARHLNGRHEAGVFDASQIWLNTDGDVDGPHSYPEGPSACGSWWYPRWGQELHSGGANYSFADGHVRWLNPGQIETIECSLGDPNFRTS